MDRSSTLVAAIHRSFALVAIPLSLFIGSIPAFKTQAQQTGVGQISAVFSLPDEVATFETDTGKLALHTLRDGKLKERVSAKVEDSVQGIVTYPQGYLVATGAGFKSMNAPIRVFHFSKTLQAQKPVFEPVSERAEVKLLRWIEQKGADPKLWITYFDTKYTTKTGYLMPSAADQWRFTEVASLRLGTAVDVAGDLVVIGRPYGDAQGQDGDLLLFQGGKRDLLPSYRGVRGLKFVGDPADPSIWVGDGWHQNYGQLAQGRVSLLKRDRETGRFALQIIDKDDSEYEFSKFFDFMLGSKRYVAALGSSKLVVYSTEGEEAKQILYTKEPGDSLIDAALISSDGFRAWFAVADKGAVKVLSFP